MNITYILGWTFLHFLWQGALIALLLALANAALRKSSARLRYAAACASLLLMLACVVVTLIRLSGVSAVEVLAGPSAIVAASPATSSASLVSEPAAALNLAVVLPWLAYFWMAGVCLLTVRSLNGWMALQRFKQRHARPAEAAWQQRMARLAQRLQISRAIRLCESAVAEVPSVIGWMRPIVLLPASALSGLTPEQLESLLAHELAHIRRHDYLMNLAQTCVETLLFYHPAVWWVSHRIRAERENCCDDLAVQVCGDALAYARALTQMEHLRCGVPRLAMAATRGSLLQRIQRIIPVSQPARPRGSRELPLRW